MNYPYIFRINRCIVIKLSKSVDIFRAHLKSAANYCLAQ